MPLLVSNKFDQVYSELSNFRIHFVFNGVKLYLIRGVLFVILLGRESGGTGHRPGGTGE